MKRKGQRTPACLTQAEQTVLLKQPNPRYPTGLRNLCLLRLLLDTGLQVKEVLRVCVWDIDWSTGHLTVRPGKGRTDRVFLMDQDLLDLLSRWRERRWVQAESLFTTLQGKPIYASYLRAMVKRYARKAGINKDVHPHMLRNSFATALYRRTEDIHLLQKVLGHVELSSTVHYIPPKRGASKSEKKKCWTWF